MKGKLLAFCTLLIATFIAFHNLGNEQVTTFHFKAVTPTSLPASHHSAPDRLSPEGTTLLLQSRLRTQTRTQTYTKNVNRCPQHQRSFRSQTHNHLFIQWGKLVNTQVVMNELSFSPLLSLGVTSPKSLAALLQVMIV